MTPARDDEESLPRSIGSSWGGLEIAAVGLLSAGGLLFPVVGPLVGVALVWVSKAWTTGQKLVGSAVALFPLFAVVLTVLARPA